MSADEIQTMIAGGETLTVEFKGEERTALNDRDLVEAIVCLANTQGGTLFIGVEDDGRITGARPRHRERTDCAALVAMVRSRTVPALEVRAWEHVLPEGNVLAIEIPRSANPVATSDGTCVRRVIAAHGPECLPWFPHQQPGGAGGLGSEDLSAHTLTNTEWSDLDPLHFERARRTIAALQGDRALLELGDQEMAQALRVVETREGRLVPNLSGLLLFGKTAALETHLPTHQAAFQVLTAGADIRVNEFFRCSLLEMAELFDARFQARNEEREVQIGMVRVPVPSYAPTAFREALLNALFHRDYRRMGTVHVQWFPERLEISSPGGFPDGVTLSNILVHEPLPRNARLYQAAKRIGLVEQTGRGVDKVFLGQLRYGRPAPDYSLSDSTGVRLTLQGGSESLEFAAFIFERERQRGGITVDEMLVLNRLHHDRRVHSEEVAELIQRSLPIARGLLERLVEEGLVEARGERRGRAYHFSAAVYRQLGRPEQHTRAHGIDPIRHEAMVIQFTQDQETVRRENVMELCGLDRGAAYRLLRRLAEEGKLIPEGTTRARTYRLPRESAQ
jgi:ATP-dependent DNA helicase RecG